MILVVEFWDSPDRSFPILENKLGVNKESELLIFTTLDGDLYRIPMDAVRLFYTKENN